MAQVKDLVIHCIDFRFRHQIADWIAENLNDQADLVAIAGVSKALNDEASRDVVLYQIEIANKLHDMTRVHLMDHVDCGAYGGSKSYSDKAAEVAMHQEELKKAAQIVKAKLPSLTVKTYVVDFDSITEI